MNNSVKEQKLCTTHKKRILHRKAVCQTKPTEQYGKGQTMLPSERSQGTAADERRRHKKPPTGYRWLLCHGKESANLVN